MQRSILEGFGAVWLSAGSLALAQEKLVLEPYPDSQTWVEGTHQVAGARFLMERVPAGQTVANYKDILVAQSLPDQRGADPSTALKGIFQLAGGTCQGVRANGPKAQVEGGYNVAYGQLYCGRQRGKSFGVTIFYKIIQGNDAQYVILREMRVPPGAVGGVQSFTQDQVAALIATMKAQSAADTFLVKSVYLCGTASTDDRCKAGPASDKAITLP